MSSSPEECVRAGQLGPALQGLQNRVRANPSNAKDRVFLFQLLALLGQWERALTQLDVAAGLDASTLILKQLYRHAILAEVVRANVFAGTTTPLVLGEPPEWIAPLLESLKLTAQGHVTKAAELRAQALEAAPARSGTVNGEAFAWLADADSRIGPCVEIILDGKYMWVPLERVRSIRIEPPTDLRDLVWTQAIFTWENGGESPALIPSRYPGAEAASDDALRMSKLTQWQELSADTYVGMGQRMLATDAGEYPLLEIREIAFAASDAGGG